MPEIKEFRENELEFWRKLFFGFIRDEVITGYNIYKKEMHLKNPIILNYLHSELGPKDKHLSELVEVLKNEADMDISEKIKDTILLRDAYYKGKNDPLWINPEKQNFYTLNGEKLEPHRLLDYDGPIIIEEVQHDLSIGINNKSELERVLKVFKEKAPYYLLVQDSSKYLICRKGYAEINGQCYKMEDFLKLFYGTIDSMFIKIAENGRIENPLHFNYGALDVLLLMLNKPSGDAWFDEISHFKFSKRDFESFLSFLVKSKRDLFVKKLDESKELFSLACEEKMKYANKLFIKQYIEII